MDDWSGAASCGLLLLVVFVIFSIGGILDLGALLRMLVLLILGDIVLVLLLLHVDHLHIVLDVVAVDVDGSAALD